MVNVMDVLRPPPKVHDENNLIILNSDRYSKLTKAIPAARKAAVGVAVIFLDNYIMPYELLSSLPYDGKLQLLEKFLPTLLSFPGRRNEDKLLSLAAQRGTVSVSIG